MCGILGQIQFDQRSHLTPKLAAIAHRGPDGCGEWWNSNKSVYFGHTRLAILEPTPAGYQPMTEPSARFTITFNGEIYNHLELRKLLPVTHWNGTSDTETLLQLIAFKGLAALELLKGMFAFAIYDAKENSVTLVRDRLGIKPLYIRKSTGFISFASEVRALIENDSTSITVQALSEYVGFGRMPNTGEIFSGVESISPGTWIKIFENGEIEQKKWWPQKKFNVANIKGRVDAVTQVEEMVTTAIEEHLISDVGVGAFLSGGIDSSIVTLVAGKVLGKRLQTFTVGFPQTQYDERIIARSVATLAGSEHFELEVTEDDCLNSVKEALESLDLPSVDAINTYIVSKAVTNVGLKVALSGLGGDELFGGYPSFKNVPFLDWLGKLPVGMARKLIANAPANVREKLEGANNYSVETLATSRRRFTSISKLKSLSLQEGMPYIPNSPNNLDMMGKISWAEMYGYMMPMLLRDSDQMSMAVGLEIRVPFLDHKLVEFALSMPEDFKKGKGVKPLLVEAFKKQLPKEVYNRPKQGFSLPMKEWLQGPLSTFTEEGIEAAADIIGLSEPLEQYKKFKKEEAHWTRVWKWCVLGHWLVKQKVGESQILV